MKKLICILIACVLAISTFAFAEGDLQAQLDEANAKIAELEALVAKYEPFYMAQFAATYGDDGVVLVSDVMAEYDEMAAYYTQYGIDLVAYGMDGQMKMDIVNANVETGVLLRKAAELGLDQLTPEQEATVAEETNTAVQSYYDSYIQYFYPDAEEVTEEMKQEAKDYWAQNGLDTDAIAENAKRNLILESVKEYITKDVTVTEEDVVAEYNALVESNKADYEASPSSFVNDYTSGETIAWYPEGHRAVKQVLISFNDDQSARYTELHGRLSDLEAELILAQNPSEETEPVEGADPEVSVEAREVSVIEAEIADVNAQIDALYEELMPEVNEVIEGFANGTPIEQLIDEHNDDPGMKNEPTATLGYPVAADSVNWDPSFTAAAMSIESKGQLSEPARGSYGIYIVYYMDDITPGAVDMETIREPLTQTALSNKIESVYNDQVDAWVKEANVTYYYANLGITEEAAQ